MSDDDDLNSLLRRKIMGYIVSQAIFAVSELKVVESLGEEAVPVEELAPRVGADPDALHRFLRVLTAEGLFVEEPARTFAVTPLGALLHRDAPGSLHHLASLMAGEAYQTWTAATHALRTGLPAFETVFGKPMFDWLGDHPEAHATFNESQAGLVTLRLLPLLDRDWSGVGTVVDVGGGNGRLLGTLLARHRQLRGVLFDLPQVAEEARHGLGDDDVRERCQVVGGDFFATVPSGGDVYVLAQILHDWADDRAVEILRRCHQAMGAGARLLILEQVIPDDSRPHPAKLLDLHMLVLLGGRERSETSWRRLLTESGFELVGIDRSARSSLIEARPVEVPAAAGAADRHDEPGDGHGSSADA
ncbi:methyltransferase [Kitasatospora sp. NPDC005856]|uniref:methyltransferase n=1 Tax=Kitasatospora sp. NPDC005856 TaxID=3154566 RepID=UPI0033FC572E